MIAPNVYALLNVPGVTGIVADRIYSHGSAAQGASNPLITWQVTAGERSNQLSGQPTADQHSIQVDGYSEDRAQVVALGEAINQALELSAHCVNQVGPVLDPDTQVWRITLDYSFWSIR